MTSWCEEGFSPSEFWEQTPRTFEAAMKGRFRAAKLKREAELGAAYNVAALSAAASVGKLKKFDHYLAQTRGHQPQGPAEMLATMKELQARGAPMTIRRVPLGEELNDGGKEGEHQQSPGHRP